MRRAMREGVPFRLLMLTLLFIVACRDKDSHEGDDGNSDLVPPAAIIFSSSGQISTVNLDSLRLTERRMHDVYSPHTAQITSSGTRIFIADPVHRKVAILHLPDLDVLDDILLPAGPVDLAIDAQAGHFYAITATWRLWSYGISTAEFDTLPLPGEPAVVRVQPTQGQYLWVVSPLSANIFVVSTTPLALRNTLHFAKPPRDVEFNADGSRAMISFSGPSGNVVELHTSSFDTVRVLDAPGGVRELALSDDWQYLACVDSAAGRVRCYDLQSGVHGDLIVGGVPGNARFGKHSHRLYVQSWSRNQFTIIDCLEAGPVLVDTITTPPLINCFALWEPVN